MHLILSLHYVLNAWRLSERPKHVVWVDGTNNIVVADANTFVSFLYRIPQRDEFYKKL